jgi:hypothetical protein
MRTLAEPVKPLWAAESILGGCRPRNHLHRTGFLWHLADTAHTYPVVRLWGSSGRLWYTPATQLLGPKADIRLTIPFEVRCSARARGSARRGQAECRESLLCELNCGLTAMGVKHFFRVECDTERGSSFAEFSKLALREFNQRHPEVSLLDDDVWLKFDAVRCPAAPKTGSP